MSVTFYIQLVLKFKQVRLQYMHTHLPHKSQVSSTSFYLWNAAIYCIENIVFELYVMTTSKVISGRVPSCDSAQSWRLCNTITLRDRTVSTKTLSLSHIIPILSWPGIELPTFCMGSLRCSESSTASGTYWKWIYYIHTTNAPSSPTPHTHSTILLYR